MAINFLNSQNIAGGITTSASSDMAGLNMTAGIAMSSNTITTTSYIGRDGDNYIGFITDNLIKFRVNGATQVKLSDGVFAPQTDSDVDLGSNSTRFANLWVDSINGSTPAVGADYLPLAGGTMTGNIVMDDSSGASPNIQFTNQSNDSWYIYNDSNGKFQVQQTSTIRATFSSGDLEVRTPLKVSEGAVSISSDGANYATLTESGSGDFTIASVDDLRLDSGGNDVVLRGASSAEFGRLSNDSNNFIIKNITADKDIIFQADDGSGGTATYFYLDGSSADGTYTYTRWNDGGVATFGGDQDLRIWHEPSNNSSYIRNYTNDFYIENLSDDKDILFRCDDGSGDVATYFFLDGSETRVTFNKNARFIDSALLELGTSGDLQIFHNSADSFIDNYTGNLTIRNRQDDGDIVFTCDDGSGGTTEYFRLDGSQTNVNFQKDAIFADNKKALFGGSGDLQLYHDGTDSYIKNTEGTFYIDQTVDDGDMKFRCDNGSGGLVSYFFLDGGSADGTYTYTKWGDNDVIALGQGKDLKIYHDGSNSFISDTGTGDLYVKASNNMFFESSAGASKIIARTGGAVDLYYNGSKKIETTSSGVEVTGTQTISSISQIGSDTDKFLMSDSGEIKYVTGANLRSYIGAGTGSGDVVASGTPVDNQVAIWTDATTVEGNANMTFSGTVLTVTGNTSTEWNTAYTDRFKWNGQSTGLLAADGRTSLGGTTVGQAFFTLTNPSAVTFPRMNADNSVSSLSASDFRTAIGAGTSSTAGTVTSVAFTEQTGNKAGITLGGSSSWTTSGTLNIGLDIQGQTALGATAAGGDYLLLYDTSGLANKKVSVTNLVAAAPQGDVTASSTTTFTNKSGNISQWTNDSGYTTNSGTVTGTGVNQRIAYWTGTSSLSSDNGLTYNSTDNKLIFNGDYAIREDGSGTFELNCDGSDIITKINGFGSNGSMTFDENSIYTTASGFYVPSGYGISAGTTSTASGTIRATGNIIAYYSDERLKDFKGNIPDALDKVCKLNGYYYTQNEKAAELGYENYERQVGVSAQEVQRVMPEVIETAPISYDNDEDYLTVDYGRLVPLLIESIKELKNEIEILKNKSCGN